MNYEIRIHSNNAESIFNKVDIETKEQLKAKIRVLEDSPKKKRAGADIKKLKNANPEAYRLRIGNYRVIYSVENNTVWITEIFKEAETIENNSSRQGCPYFRDCPANQNVNKKKDLKLQNHQNKQRL